MLRNKSKDTDLSRRQFMQFMAGASLASMSGVLPAVQAQAKPTSKRTIPMPKFKVQTSNKTAFERYQCKPDLKRFGSENMAFKVTSEELGFPFNKAYVANLKRNMQNGDIGHGWPVKDPVEARIWYALNVAMTTWNDNIGPYGENRENTGFLSWLPQGLPEDFTSTPLPLENTADLTRKIKVIAAYAGADKTGIAKIDPRWMFNSVCLNGLDPGPPQIKHIVMKDVAQPSENEKEFIMPDSVRYAIVIINVQPRALTQLAPSSIASVASTNQGYAQGALTAVALSQAIRSLGYVAIPCMNSTALVPQYGPHCAQVC
jgi:hypothetical protein